MYYHLACSLMLAHQQEHPAPTPQEGTPNSISTSHQQAPPQQQQQPFTFASISFSNGTACCSPSAAALTQPAISAAC
jgi:hypothetical protein